MKHSTLQTCYACNLTADHRDGYRVGYCTECRDETCTECGYADHDQDGTTLWCKPCKTAKDIEDGVSE